MHACMYACTLMLPMATLGAMNTGACEQCHVPDKARPRQVMLTHAPAGGGPRPAAAVTERDAEGQRPLDLAITSQQWPAVRLLVAAGALDKCPEVGGPLHLLCVLQKCRCSCSSLDG